MKLFEWNKERKAKENIKSEAYNDYRQLVKVLCPDDFTVRVGDRLDAEFILKGTNWGFIMDSDVAYNTTEGKQLERTINLLAEDCRKTKP